MAGKRTKTLCFEKVLSLSPQKRKKVARERATFEKNIFGIFESLEE